MTINLKYSDNTLYTIQVEEKASQLIKSFETGGNLTLIGFEDKQNEFIKLSKMNFEKHISSVQISNVANLNPLLFVNENNDLKRRIVYEHDLRKRITYIRIFGAI